MDKKKTGSNQQSPIKEESEEMIIPDFWGKTRGPGSGPSYSPVWNYFVLDDDNPILATCLICGIRMSRGGITPNRCGTTNLRRHLSYAHGLSLPSKRRTALANQTGPSSSTTSSKASSSSSTNTLSQVKSTSVTSQRTHLRPILPKKQMNQFFQPSDQSKSKVRLRWNSYHSNMQAAFPSLLYSEQFVDVTLACEGKSIKCHKVMLSACSSYFEDLLTHNPCKHPIILMKDLRFWEVRALVDFMYNGEVNVQEDKLPSLLAAAEALQIKGLTGPSNNSSADGEMEEESVPPTENCTPIIDERLMNKTPPVKRRGRKRKIVAPVSKQNKLRLDSHKTQSDAKEKESPGSPIFMEAIIKEEPVDDDLVDESMCVGAEQEECIVNCSSSDNVSDNHRNEEKPKSNQSSCENSSNQINQESQRENLKTVKIKDILNKSVPVKADCPVKNKPKSVFPCLRNILSDKSPELCDDDDDDDNGDDDDDDDDDDVNDNAIDGVDDDEDGGGGDNDKPKCVLKRIKTDSVSDDSVSD